MNSRKLQIQNRVVCVLTRPHPGPLPEEREKWFQRWASSTGEQMFGNAPQRVPSPGGEGQGEGGRRTDEALFQQNTLRRDGAAFALRFHSGNGTVIRFGAFGKAAQQFTEPVFGRASSRKGRQKLAVRFEPAETTWNCEIRVQPAVSVDAVGRGLGFMPHPRSTRYA
jgi:hypothetical protein